VGSVAAMARRRVALIVHSYPIMSEVFISYAALGLVRAGWSVDIIAVSGAESAGAEAHPVQAELEREIRVIRATDVTTRGPGSAMRSLMAQRGIGALKTIDPTRFARDTFTLRPLLLAEALSRGGPYDVVHCQFGTLAAPVLALRRAGLLDARVVVHFRGADISTYVRQFGASAYDTVFDEADWFAANCRHFRNLAIELGCDPARIDVVPSGCDVARFPFAPRTAPETGPTRLLAVGRLVGKKGHDLAIAAMGALRDRGRDARLRIVGDGPLRDDLEAAVAAAGLGDRVEFAGELPHAAIADELARAHIFIAPSRQGPDGDQDGPVNTLKEAMACGAPVVAARHGGIPELVEHGVNGLLCAEDDAGDLADRIDEMLDAAPLWPAFGRAGRRTVEAKFSLEVATKKLVDVYAKTLAQPEFTH
jgi:colanic acid/amylovoran biosynthesis glycosyltransferase